MGPRKSQDGAQMEPKIGQDWAKKGPGWGQDGPRWVEDGAQSEPTRAIITRFASMVYDEAKIGQDRPR